MFSKYLLKLSSFGPRNTKLIVRSNRLTNPLMRNSGSSIKRIDGSTFTFELPPLMNFDTRETQFPVMIPSRLSFFHRIFIDKSYNETGFIDRAKQTVSTISSHLANDNIEGIKSLVTSEAFEELSQNYKKLSTEQKRELKVDVNDILQCFVLGLKVNKVSENVFDVKIVVLIEMLRDSDNAVNQKILSHIRTKEFYDESNEFKHKLLEPLLDQKYLCSYEFSRLYGSGETKNWAVSRLAHFKYKDIWKYLQFID